MENQLLDVIEQEDSNEIIPVEKGTRFINYLIDLAIFYVSLVLFLFLLDQNEFGFVQQLAKEPILDRLFSMFCYGVFMCIQELIFKGRSIGKFLTGTKVVDEYGNTPASSTLLARNLSRMVPFDQLSFLGERGWHDSWSNTYVVKKK